MSSNLDIELIDFLDLINNTLSLSFKEKWRYKYSDKFIAHFQAKLLDAMQKGKPIKKQMLYNYLVRKCKYADEQVMNFFDTIDIDIYSPFIYGTID
jgi:hypothetical protein